LRRLEAAAADPAKAEIAEQLKAHPLDISRANLVRAVLESKQPQILTHVSLEFLRSLTENEEHQRLMEATAPESAMAVPLVAHGKFLGALLFVSSRADRRYTTLDLPLAEELAYRAALALDNARLYEAARHAIKARDDVLGIVAHDLRNPLNAILMACDRLTHHGPGPDRRAQRPAESIQRAALRMSRLIQDLLDVTRIEAGGFSVERARVAARDVVLDAAETHKPLLSSAGLELAINVAHELPTISVDRDQLLRVFDNLLGNAVKFTPPGGRVTVAAALRGADVLFWVDDTGVGIPRESLAHVFDRFWQARPGGRGAGLGLPIVKGIVEAHGGRVWIESTPGRGTTSYFTIPVTAPAEESRPAILH
jgi:signal transduction histidine kinase